MGGREQMALFRHIYRPLAALFPNRTANELGVTARSLFSAVHGMVTLGLEQKLIAVPPDALRVEIALIVRAMVRGWKVNFHGEERIDDASCRGKTFLRYAPGSDTAGRASTLQMRKSVDWR